MLKEGKAVLEPTKALKRFLSNRPRARAAVLFVSVLSVGGAIVLFVLRPVFTPALSGVSISLQVLLAAGGLYLMAVTLEAYERADFQELSSIREKREKLQEKIVDQRQADVFEIVQLSLMQGTEYYTINKSQARKSFSFSVFAIALGLGTVIGGVWLMYSKRFGLSVGVISAVSGVMLQFFGGANFYIYNKSLGQMNYFYDRLMQMQDAQVAIKVGEQIQDAALKDKVKQLIVSELLQSKAVRPARSMAPNRIRRKAPVHEDVASPLARVSR